MNQTAYQAALDGAAFYQNPTAGCLRISGRDTVAFVQRQTTNDVRHLKSDTGLLTVLTSPAARILDVFYLVAEPGDAKVDTSPTWLAFCMGGRTVETARFLQKRIFFMDQLEVANHSENIQQIELFGPQAGEILVRLGLNYPPEPNQVTRLAFHGLSLIIMNPHPEVGLGYRLAIPTGGLDAVKPCPHSSRRFGNQSRNLRMPAYRGRDPGEPRRDQREFHPLGNRPGRGGLTFKRLLHRAGSHRPPANV